MKLAIFELDGCLLEKESVRWQAQCLSEALAQVIGIEEAIGPRGSYKNSTDIGIFLEVFEKNMGRPPSSGETGNVRRTLAQLLAQNPKNFRPAVGAMQILEAIDKAGWKTALGLGTWKEAGEYKLEASGLPIEFIAGIGLAASDSIEREKAIQNAWNEAKTFCGVPSFEKVVVVGSGPWELKAASSLNLPFVGVGSDSLKPPVILAPDFSDAAAFIKALESAAVVKS